MITEFAVGDAYGRVFEFNTHEFTKENNDAEGYKHREGETVNGIGIYTDDTQMMLGVAECMLDDVSVNSQIRYAHHFMNAYHRDKRGGYSRRIRGSMDASDPKYPFQFLLKNKPAGYKSNGSVMRTLPLGLYNNTDRVIHECMVHTSATHGSMEAFHATVATALTAHYLYHVRVPHDLIQDLMDFQNWMKEKLGPVYDMVMDSDANMREPLPCDGMRSAAASIRMVWEESDPKVILWRSIERGGDVDTLAAVSLGLWKLKMLGDELVGRKPVHIPKVFVDNLENGKYGRDYLIEIDKKLYAKFPSLLTVKETTK